MPITISGLSDDEREGIDTSGGALDPDAVYFQYLCQTGEGEHDPDKPPDERVRPSHAALHGTIWRLDDPNAPIPPVDFGCRCAISYVSAKGTPAAKVLPVAPKAPVTDHREPARDWLTANVPEWREVAKAAAEAPPQRAEVVAFAEATKRGLSRDIARLILQTEPPGQPTPLGIGPLAGIGARARQLVRQWMAGDLAAGAKLARSYPATYQRILFERPELGQSMRLREAQ